MTKYNFDEGTQRRGTDCVKWDSNPDPEMLPMWVADMDFKTAPPIIEAVCNRATSGLYGYVKIPDSYYEAIINWFATRHGWEINRDEIIYIPGIVPALTVLVKALTKEGEGVIFQTPAYNCFFSSVEENNRKMILNPLKPNYADNGINFEIDFEQLEKLACCPENTMMILCNPHNPTGRVWTRGELQRISEICKKNNVMVVSDEIHCEIIHPGHQHIPFATIDTDCITCCSPTKGFNIAGLMVSNIITRRKNLRDKINQVIKASEANGMNPFGEIALQAAYNHGAEWLDELNLYLYDNYKILVEEFAKKLPKIRFCNSEATYLAWADISELGLTSAQIEARAKELGHVWINAGSMYGGEGFIRINYACQRKRLLEGIERLHNALKDL